MFKDNEDLYHKYKNNLVGGPSIIFSHYQEKNITLIRAGKQCKSIMGFNAYALYLMAIGENMLCGEHTIVEKEHTIVENYNGLIEDISNGTFYGVVECDIAVPEHLKNYFNEMQPIFKNTEIAFNDVSFDTQAQIKENYKSKKLVGSYFGNKMLFHTDLLM